MMGLLVPNRDLSERRYAAAPLQPILPMALRRLIAAFFTRAFQR